MSDHFELSAAELMRMAEQAERQHKPRPQLTREQLDALIDAAIEADRLGYSRVRQPADWLDPELDGDGHARERERGEGGQKVWAETLHTGWGRASREGPRIPEKRREVGMRGRYPKADGEASVGEIGNWRNDIGGGPLVRNLTLWTG